MRTFASLLALSGLVAASAFVAPAVPTQRAKAATRVQAGGAGDDEWRNIVGSEANLRQYLGKEGFRYCLNKTPEELEKEGDYGLLEKMFGATSNNEARLAARQYGRNLKIDEYDAKKAAENKEWIAKYGYKRWGTSYMDKANLEAEQGVKSAAKPGASKPAAAPKAAAPSKPAFSFSFGGGAPKAAAAPKAGGSAVKAGGSAVKVAAAKPAAAAPKAAAPAPKAAAPKAAAPSGPLSAKPASSAPKGNLNLLKKPGSS